LQWPVQRVGEAVRWSESPKAGLSSDWGLQLDPMKVESLVIADQQRRGEYVPGPCTHRPSRHESWQHPKLVAQPHFVGREYRKVGLDHLLSKESLTDRRVLLVGLISGPGVVGLCG